MGKFGAKYSIRKQMMVMFVGLILFLLILLVSVNGLFSEWYYIQNKKMDMMIVYNEICTVQKKGKLKHSYEIEKRNRMA